MSSQSWRSMREWLLKIAFFTFSPAAVRRPPAFRLRTEQVAIAKRRIFLRWRYLRGGLFSLGATIFLAVLWFGTLPVLCGSAAANAPPSTAKVSVLEVEGSVEFSPMGSTEWYRCAPNQVLFGGDQLRCSARSRAVLRFADQTRVRLGELSLVQIPRSDQNPSEFSLVRGLLYFFHRPQSNEIRLRTPLVSAVVRGTEFNLSVAADGTTTLTMITGEVEMMNGFGKEILHDNQQGVVAAGEAPRRTAALESRNVIQWCLYYPAVLDAEEVPFSGESRQALAASLLAYRSGDVLTALEAYPRDRKPQSGGERVYLAALLLAVGEVAPAEAMLKKDLLSVDPAAPEDQVHRLALGLQQLIGAVQLRSTRSTAGPVLATEWLAESYVRQAQRQLGPARDAARQALKVSPRFGFGWSRLAELEFSFGLREDASHAVGKSLSLAPCNAEAHALQGFLLASANEIDRAIREFDRALAIDGALGNAWLGRGLCRIRGGDAWLGQEDLQVAALVEPNRALLRSYLGKADVHLGEDSRGEAELNLAKRLDPQDPTAWFYSALLRRQQSRINEAVDDLRHSMALNDNRAVYRSELLLDQDRAMRGVNLAAIYQEAGLNELSFWEASRAVSGDYADFSAHLFLANSYDRLRDPRQVDLRYETPWLSEYLLANLLAPVGAGMLSAAISQQEYSRLFESDRVGVISSTEYDSRGDWVQSGAQFGTFGDVAYSLEAYYRSERGQRPNNDQQQTTAALQVKYQLNARDTLYLQPIYYNAEGGDLAQFYDPADANLGLRTSEKQEPALLVGYHREWQPGVHTLFLAGRMDDHFKVLNPNQSCLLLEESGGRIDAAFPMSLSQEYESHFEACTFEAQQIFQQSRNCLLFGARYQSGKFETKNQQQVENSVSLGPFLTLKPSFFDPVDQEVGPQFERVSAYAYDHLRVLDSLLLVGGLAFDRVTYPSNFRYAPLSHHGDRADAVSPKAGLVWSPFWNTTVRAAFTRSLGGVSFDQSVRLEPAQIVGFTQAYRSLIPESLGGAEAVPEFETWGLSLEQRLPTRTYLGLGGEILKSESSREIGVFTFQFPPESAVPSETAEQLDYQEDSLTVSVAQLLGNSWSAGTVYRLSHVELEDKFPRIPNFPLSGFQSEHDLTALLHQLELFAIFNHPSGFFAQSDATLYSQSPGGYQAALEGDRFWQVNVFAGYRFLQRRAEVKLGILNLADQDYRLDPLNSLIELPRSRALLVSLRFAF